MKSLFALLVFVLPFAAASQTIYWINGTGSWNDPTRWSTGQIPTASDDVVFNAGSGAPIVNINVAATCRSMTWSTGTNGVGLSGTQQLNVYGSLLLEPNMSMTYSGDLYFKAGTGSNLLTTNGNLIAANLYFDGAGTWNLLDGLTTSGTGKNISLLQGTLNTNGQPVFARQISSSSGSIRNLILGSSTLTLTSTATNTGAAWYVSTSNMTLDGSSSHIILTGATNAFFFGGGFPYNDLDFNTSPTGTGTLYGGSNGCTFHDVAFLGNGAISGDNVFNDVTIAGNATISGENSYNDLTLGQSKTHSLNSNDTQTIGGTFTANGTCAAPLILNGGSGTSFATLSSSGPVVINYVRLNNVHATGGGSFIANNVTDFGNNTGWTLNQPAPQTLHWIGTGGSWNNAANWTLPGGAPSGCIPTIYDDVVFDASSSSVLVDGQAYCKNMLWTAGATNSTMGGTARLDIYGSMTLSTAMNTTYTGDVYFKSLDSSPRTLTTAGKQPRSDLYFEGAASWALLDPLTTYSTGKNISLLQGTLNTNGQPVFARQISSSSGSIRNLILGSSTLTLTSTATNTGAAWYVSTSNMTLDGSSSHIILTGATNAFFFGGGFPYNDLDFNTSPTGTGTLYGGSNGCTFHDVSFSGNGSISGDNTFHDVTLAASRTYTFSNNTTQTLNGDLTANGIVGNPTVLTGSGACTTSLFKATGSVCISYCTLNNVCATGGASFGTQNSTLNSSTGWLPNSCPGLNCTASLSPTAISIGPSSSAHSVYVGIPVSCAWSVTGVPAWITWTSALSGSGPVTLGFTIQANPGPDPRSATITVAGEALYVSQAVPGCSYALSPSSNFSVAAVGATGQSVAVTAASGCGWTAVVSDSWLTITAGFAGFGNGTVNYNIANNPGVSPRSGSMLIAGQVFQVTQLGTGSTATYSISASNQPEYASWPNTPLSTGPLKLCADGSSATWVTVSVTGVGGIPTSALRFKFHNATPDLAFSGAFNNAYDTSVPGQSKTRISHPTYVAIGNTPYRTDILEVYEDGNQGTILASCPVRIYRTPIAFIHGLVGGQSTFQSMTSSLLSDNMYPGVTGLLSGSPLLHRVDYTLSSVQRFHNNRFVVRNAIDYTIGQAIGQGYSCGKASVFGHSMGGVLSRLYLYSMNGVAYREDMNRLITINTPHRGTQFANFCGTTIPNPGCGPVLALFGFTSSLYGAVQDLKVNSKPIKRMNTWPQWDDVPCAALSSDQFNDGSAGANAARTALFFALSPLWNIYDGEDHDLIVPETSQTSGLGSYPTAAQQWHIGSAGNSVIIDHVEQMLDVNPTNSTFYSQTGFPQGLLSFFQPGPVDQMSAVDGARVVASIEILDPSAGAVFSPGSTVTLDISYSDITDMALIVTGSSIDPITIDTVAVDEITFQVPLDAVGTLSIFLLGGDGTDWTVSDDTYITISSPVVPDSIICSPSSVTLPLGLTQFVQADGFFGNSNPVDLYGSPSLSVSPGGAVLGYDGDGVFQALSVGAMDIVFDYFGVSDTVHFTVVDDPSALVAGFDYSTEEICVNSAVTFTDQSQGLELSRQWTFQGGTPATSTDSIPSVTYATPGTYTVELITTFVNGADTLTLDSLITVLPGPDLSVIVGSSLSANALGATYQWINCVDAVTYGTPIVGATDQEYIPSANGYYAVIVTEGQCTGTSSCVFYGSTDLASTTAYHGITVQPNPTRGAFIVQLPKVSHSVRVEVTDVANRVLLVKNINDVQQLQLQLDEPSGVYLLNVYVGDNKTTFKLVKN